jgi:Ca2+/Na+ antiporter
MIISIKNPEEPETISKWLSIILAITLFIYSGCLIFSGVFSLKEKLFDISFVYSVVFIGLGVVLCSNLQMLGGCITVFIGTVLAAFGMIELGEATAMIFFKRKLPLIVVFFVLGAAFITLGVLALVLPEAKQFVYIGISAGFILLAIFEIILGVYALVKRPKEEETKEEKVTEEQVEKEEPVQVIEESSEEAGTDF